MSGSQVGMTGQPEKRLRTSCTPSHGASWAHRAPRLSHCRWEWVLPPPPLCYRRRQASLGHHLPLPVFSTPLAILCWGRGDKLVYIKKGHHREIQNKNGFKVHISKIILEPEVVRTHGQRSSDELVTADLTLAYRDGQQAKCKGTRKVHFGLPCVPFSLTLQA